MKILIRSLAFLVVSSAVLATVFLFRVDYEIFTRLLLESTGKLHRLKEFQGDFLTFSKFRFLRYGSLVSSFLLIVLFFKFSRRLEEVAVLLRRGFARLGGFFKETAGAVGKLNRFEQTLLFLAALLLVGYRAYQLVNLPPSYDEAFTYLNYSSKNLLVSASHYQSPNNHIFFSLLTNFASLLPLDPLFAIRLPNFLLGFLASFVVFGVITKRLGASAGLVAAILFSFSYPISLYSIHARGYLLYLLFSLIGTHSLLTLVLEGESRFHWVMLTFSSILGFYTIPTFFYPYASIFLFGLLAFGFQKRGAAIQHLFLSALVTGLIVIVLYLPILLMNGLHLARQYGFLERSDSATVRSEMMPYFRRVMVWLAGGNKQGPLFVGSVILASLVASLSSHRSVRTLSLLSLLFFFLAPCLIFIQRVFPHERAWIYLVFILVTGLAAFLVAMPKQGLRLGQVACVIFPFFSLFHFRPFYEQSFKYDFPVASLVRAIEEKSISLVYSDYDHFEVLYRFENLRRGRYPVIDANVSLDTEKSYDLVVLNPKSAESTRLPEDYQLIFEAPPFKAFMKKGNG